MENFNYFWIRISVTFIAIIGIILHLILPSIQIDNIIISFLAIAIIPWLSIFFKSIEIPGIFRGEFKDDKGKEFVGEPIINNEKEIKIGFQKVETNNLTKKENASFLSFNARINYTEEAGSTYLMRLYVNGILVEGNRLRNKPIIKKYVDNREFSWFHIKYGSWNLQYSPDFQSNYSHEKYKVVNGDPYNFLFSINDILALKNEIEVKFIHDGRKDVEAHKNPIVVSDIKVY